MRIMESKFERLLNKGCKFLTRGHDFVEIGGIKWATCNVGAEKPTDAGLYFAWGETKGYTAKEIDGHKHSFTSESYNLDRGLAKYNEHDRKTVLDRIDDPVAINWGGRWRLPTAEEIQILKSCSFFNFVKDYEHSGVNGLLIIDKQCHERKIFLPAAGYGNFFNCEAKNEFGLYWNRTLSNCSTSCGGSLRFYIDVTDWDDCYNRSFGFSVRGILDI